MPLSLVFGENQTGTIPQVRASPNLRQWSGAPRILFVTLAQELCLQDKYAKNKMVSNLLRTNSASGGSIRLDCFSDGRFGCLSFRNPGIPMRYCVVPNFWEKRWFGSNYTGVSHVRNFSKNASQKRSRWGTGRQITRLDYVLHKHVYSVFVCGAKLINASMLLGNPSKFFVTGPNQMWDDRTTGHECDYIIHEGDLSLLWLVTHWGCCPRPPHSPATPSPGITRTRGRKRSKFSRLTDFTEKVRVYPRSKFLVGKRFSTKKNQTRSAERQLVSDFLIFSVGLNVPGAWRSVRYALIN